MIKDITVNGPLYFTNLSSIMLLDGREVNRGKYSETKIRKMIAVVRRARAGDQVSIDGTKCYADVNDQENGESYVVVGDYRVEEIFVAHITPPKKENENMTVSLSRYFSTPDEESSKHILDAIKRNLELMAWAWHDCWLIEMGTPKDSG